MKGIQFNEHFTGFNLVAQVFFRYATSLALYPREEKRIYIDQDNKVRTKMNEETSHRQKKKKRERIFRNRLYYRRTRLITCNA